MNGGTSPAGSSPHDRPEFAPRRPLGENLSLSPDRSICADRAHHPRRLRQSEPNLGEPTWAAPHYASGAGHGRAGSTGDFGSDAFTQRARQRDPRAGHGRGAACEFRPPRHADGDGGHRRGAVERLPAARSGRPRVAGSRPLRALQRARLDARLRAPPPHRLCAAARRDQEFSPAPLDDPGPPRVRRRTRGRDDDRAARSGPRERGGHGDRGEGPRGALQP